MSRVPRWTAPVALALGIQGCLDGPTEPPAGTLAPAIDVAWIALEPRLPAPASIDAPPEAGWPEPGAEVRWVSHVVNSATEAAPDVPWSWIVDGMRVDSGTVTLPPGTTELTLSRTWRAEAETIELRLDPRDGDAAGDALSVSSRALSIGFWVEQPIWDRMAASRALPVFSVWARREVQAWNTVLDGFRSEAIPGGIRDRLRLDRVVVVPEGTPWPVQFENDLPWYFPGGADRRFLQADSDPGVAGDQTIVLHELLHQRGIVDIYAYEVRSGGNGSRIDILDPDGAPAVGSDRMPLLGCCTVYEPPFEQVLMGVDLVRPVEISEHTAFGLNLVAGRRTPRWPDPLDGAPINGFATVAPAGNEYVYRVPAAVELELVDSLSGAALDGAAVDIFFDESRMTYVDQYPEQPQLTVAADGSGRAPVPLERLAAVSQEFPPGADVIILRIRRGEFWGYAFLPVYELNLAYVAGDRDVTRRTVRVTLR